MASFKGQDGVLGVAQGQGQGQGLGAALSDAGGGGGGEDLEDEGALEREHWKERVRQAESDLLREQETSSRFFFRDNYRYHHYTFIHTHTHTHSLTHILYLKIK